MSSALSPLPLPLVALYLFAAQSSASQLALGCSLYTRSRAHLAHSHEDRSVQTSVGLVIKSKKCNRARVKTEKRAERKTKDAQSAALGSTGFFSVELSVAGAAAAVAAASVEGAAAAAAAAGAAAFAGAAAGVQSVLWNL